MRLVQLRLKELPDHALTKKIAAARDLAAAHGATMVVNDHWRLAIEAGCDWVHLGQEDLDEADLPAIRRAGLKLGLSAPTTMRSSTGRSPATPITSRSARSIRRS